MRLSQVRQFCILILAALLLLAASVGIAHRSDAASHTHDSTTCSLCFLDNTISTLIHPAPPALHTPATVETQPPACIVGESEIETLATHSGRAPPSAAYQHCN